MYIYTNPHQQSWDAAQQELSVLSTERDQLTERLAWINQRIAQLQAHCQSVAPLIAQDPGAALSQVGLTQLCRSVLEHNPRWMTAQEARHILAQMGVDISKYSNPMSTLHSILRRVAAWYRGEDGNLYYGHPLLPRAVPAREPRPGRS